MGTKENYQRWLDSSLVSDETKAILRKMDQKDIDDAWADYNDEKEKTIKDVNDFLDDYGMIPMIKIGFMYRF